jgi:hypothetical protein
VEGRGKKREGEEWVEGEQCKKEKGGGAGEKDRRRRLETAIGWMLKVGDGLQLAKNRFLCVRNWEVART